jgi:hypothetical protein
MFSVLHDPGARYRGTFFPPCEVERGNRLVSPTGFTLTWITQHCQAFTIL